MKRCLFIFVAGMWMISAGAQVNRWDEVTKLEQQSLPASALEVVNQIYREALKSGNTPELIKTIIHQLKYETAINGDVLPDRIREIEQFAATEKNAVGQAVLYSLLAEIYAQYYRVNAYTIDQRTEITGVAPKDLREWTKNLIVEKVKELVRLSLLPASELQQTDVSAYSKILIEGESSRKLRPTLYDFLLAQNIQALSPLNINELYLFALELYGQWLDFRTLQEKNAPTHDNRLALLMVELERLEFVRNNSQDEDAGDHPYISALMELETQYSNDDFYVEILYRMALYHQQDWNDNRDESLKKVYEICRNGIEKYPNYERIGLLKNLLSDITQSNFNIQSQNTAYPDKNLELKINYRNTSQLTIEIYKIAAPVTIYSNTWTRQGQYQKSGTRIEKRTVELINPASYLYSDTIVRIPVKEMGNYEYVVYSDENPEALANQQFSVSRLATVSRGVDGQMEFLVTDRISGKPIVGAEIRLFTRKGNTLELAQPVKTDKQGLATGNNRSDLSFYQVVYVNDTALILSPVPWIPTTRINNTNTIRLDLFTDRSIYRPGQTVYFKGIAYLLEKENVFCNGRYTITFRDANNKEIANRTVTTNEFGSFSGEFVIPQGVMNGTFRIHSDVHNGSATIDVEEYKRPSFDIQFLPNENTYRFGDTVTVKGKAQTFSGIHLQNTDVQYRVTRRNHWFFRWNGNPPAQIAKGDVQTDSDGNFEIRFPAVKPVVRNDFWKTGYIYTIEAIVTDSNGETQSSSAEVFIGDQSLFLSINGLNERLLKEESQSIVINAANMSGRSISVSGVYDVYRLKMQDATRLDWDDKDWTLDKKVLSGRFQSGKNLDTRPFQSLPSGRYRIVAKAGDNQGREEEKELDFTLSSIADKRPPVPVYEWLVNVKDTCAVGESAEVVLGSSAKEVYVLYELFKENKRIHVSRFMLNNENKKIKIPFFESYGDGITVMFSFIKDGRYFTQSIQIYKKRENQKLNLRMEVFRDRLLPGGHEEWKLSVKDGANRPVTAEVLAAMYDASLDKLQNHVWYFDPVRPVRFGSITTRSGNDFGSSYDNWHKQQQTFPIADFRYDSFNWFGFYITGGFGGRLLGATRASSNVMFSKLADKDEERHMIAQEPVMVNVDYESDPDSPVESTVQIRQNFNETAFFYPQLRTNEAGETLISFAVPESNTTWKFMGLAHTADLKFGQIVQEAISQKKLMVTPNIPRFLRAGDRATILSNISNLTDETINGTATLDLFDPVTDKSMISVTDRSKPFTIEAGQTTPVGWTFDVPDGLDLTAIRIVASSTDFSDGEQHLLPILPNRMMVTESLSLNVLGGQTRTFSLTPLFGKPSPTMEDYRTTLEFASNPTWYAVQALPSVSTPQTDNVLSWFAAYYVNTMAAQIARSTPNIRQMIEIWTKQAGDQEVLSSNLEKNQDLKTILLEETPWVLEAENETEQKQRLISLFDANRIQYINTQALEKLQSLQTGDGGWSWFKGMSGSVSITQWILYGMASIRPNDRGNMVENAVHFIDRQFKKHYDDLKKNNSAWKQTQSFSTYTLEYLLVRSYYKDIPLSDVEEAVGFYTGIVEKYWAKNTDLYGRALAAIIMQRNNNPKIAQAILKSLREHASRKPDLGMYWANNNARSFMSQSAVSVHTFIMEAFCEAGCSPAEMDEMKLWLLAQKQTQMWESVPATVNAIDMLLKTGNDWLKSSNEVDISIDGRSLDFGSAEPGTGYFKAFKAFKGLKAKNLIISKSSPGPAYGALYRQYFEDLDKITSAKTGLSVEKSFITPNNDILRVGDKVTIRLTVRVDRDMEYVSLKDLRASCFEPVDQISGVQWKQGVMYYQSPKDASMNFFFSVLPKGTYVFEYNVYVRASGDYSDGITTIQCMYAPQFVSHTAGKRIKVE